jgi:hypothetical protein
MATYINALNEASKPALSMANGLIAFTLETEGLAHLSTIARSSETVSHLLQTALWNIAAHNVTVSPALLKIGLRFNSQFLNSFEMFEDRATIPARLAWADGTSAVLPQYLQQAATMRREWYFRNASNAQLAFPGGWDSLLAVDRLYDFLASSQETTVEAIEDVNDEHLAGHYIPLYGGSSGLAAAAVVAAVWSACLLATTVKPVGRLSLTVAAIRAHGFLGLARVRALETKQQTLQQRRDEAQKELNEQRGCSERLQAQFSLGQWALRQLRCASCSICSFAAFFSRVCIVLERDLTCVLRCAVTC